MTTKSRRKSAAEAPPPVEAPQQESGDADGSGEDVASTSTLRQFVTFVVGTDVFAVALAPVQEIIRVPSIVRVPLAPASLDGLANLRGRVLPIVSLRRMCGLPERAHDDATRALVIDYGQAIGFVVDKVLSVVSVDATQIEDVGSLQAAVNTELLAGIITEAAGHAMIMLLDFERLIAREFTAIRAATSTGTQSVMHDTPVSETSDDDGVSDELQLVSFSVAGQEYAIPIEFVQEIVQVPENVVHVPRSESHVLGMITLRQRVLPLVSLRRMFALEDQAADERSRIVVVALDGVSVGIVMDSVNEVLRVTKSAVDPMPALLSREPNLSEISQLCQLDGGKRLVSIIDPKQLFAHATIQETMSTMNDAATGEGETRLGSGASEEDEQVVVFRLDEQEFGVPIESVQEIVRVPEELTRVPKTPHFVEGVINLRGAVLPVIDLRTRLGLDGVTRSDRQRVMVFLLDGHRTGFIVDSVAEVLRIPLSSIVPAPRLSSGQGQLLSRTANLQSQKRMVQLLVPELLVGSDDLTALAQLVA